MGNHHAAEVKLDHQVYFPGNIVRGTATIRFDEPTLCLAARIACRGTESAICVREGIQSEHQDTTIFKETLTLFGHTTVDSDETQYDVPAGTYTYPFAFELPLHLPSTTSLTNWGTGGVEVKYCVSAFVKFAKDHFDEGHAAFTVITPANSRDVIASPPVATTDLVHLHTYLANKGTCNVEVRIEHSLYAPDDTMLGYVMLDNRNGEIAIDHVHLSLTCHCETQIDKSVAGTEYDLAGSATSHPLLQVRVACMAAAGKQAAAPIRLKLPHVIQYPSYPATGKHYRLKHELVVDVAGKRIALPVLIAACADSQNRFATLVPTQRAYDETVAREYKYSVPDDCAVSATLAVSKDTPLPAQPPVSGRTPQAVGDGHGVIA